MVAPPIPHDETERLAELLRYAVLDTETEVAFDRIARVAQTVFGTPIALVSLVDQNRQWFKAEIGLGVSETPRSVSFCAHALTEPGPGPMVIEDAADDLRFSDNPLVTGDPRIRFYAGAPITTPRGFNLGTLCVIDRKPRSLSAEQRQLLSDLAAMVVNELELRQSRRVAEQRAASFEQLVNVFNRLPQGVVLFDGQFRCVYANEAMGEIFALPAKQLLGWTPETANAHVALLSDDPDQARDVRPGLREVTEDGIPSGLFTLARPRRRTFRRSLHRLADPDRPWLAMWTDVTHEDDQLRQSQAKAATDALTGLPNRRAADDYLKVMLGGSSPVSIAIFDVDHFKRVNDTYGHGVGDEVLRQVASTLTSSARGGDFVARWGGEEFIAVVRAGADGARALAERVRSGVEQLSSPAGKVTLSAGVARIHAIDEVSRADERLYEAKRAGRNCVVGG